MSTICKNCNHSFEGNYCNNCGQAASTHEINLRFLWHDIQHGLLHFDKGLPFTIKELFTRPGYSVREFIEGKRVQHFKPISLVLVLATLYGLLYHYFHIDNLSEMNPTVSEQGKSFLVKTNEWVSTHYALTALLTLPLYTLGSALAFARQGYNMVEHVVLNAFLLGQRLCVYLITFPVLLWLNGSPAMRIYQFVLTLVEISLMLISFSQFFSRLSKTKTILLSLLCYLIFVVSFSTISLLIGFIINMVYH